jgi:hypothetical protein
VNNIHHENPKRKSTKTIMTTTKKRMCVCVWFSSERTPFPERRVIYPNGIFPAPPILLLLHHLRHLGDFRSPPIRRLCMGHHDNGGHPNTTDKPCCCFICICDTVYCHGCVKLLLLLLLRRLRTWWPHWPATDEAIGPRATRARRRRYRLFGRNTADVDGQRLRFSITSATDHTGVGVG